jgi:Hypothetical methyltransferase
MKTWTVDPVKVIANKINNLPIPDRIIAKMVIGDFGCGRARLAELLNVYDFDHHDIYPYFQISNVSIAWLHSQ